MTRLLASWLIAIVLLLQLSIASAATATNDCAALGKLVPYCGLSNPEDLEVLPDGSGVIASDIHVVMTDKGLAGQPGTLKWFDAKTRAITVLYPSASAPAARNEWGDATCPGEIGTALMPHGFQLSQRANGAWQLLVVNHGGRESVEFFELIDNKFSTNKVGKKNSGHQWSLAWRGCVIPSGTNHLNDVAALPGGGLLVSTMHTLGNSETRNAMQRAEHGENTGFLWRWMPGMDAGAGLTHQAGSDSPMPNGVQVDATGHYAYLNTASKGGDVRKLDLTIGEVVATVSVPNPDNSSWATDGRLLIAGVAAGASSMPCFAHPSAVCVVASDVYAIDTHSMQVEHLFGHAGPPLGGATVAVQLGKDLLIGSCFGDRIMAVRDFFKAGTRNALAATQERAP